MSDFEMQETMNQEETENTPLQQEIPVSELLGDISGLLFVRKKGEEKKAAAQSLVSLSVRKGKNDILLYLDINPVEASIVPLEVPIGTNFAILVAASIRGGSRTFLQDIKGEWQCKFHNGYNTVRFFFSQYGDEYYYELRLVKTYPNPYRLIGKMKNMIAPLEGWSVTLPSNPAITVSKRLKDIKPIVEITTSRSSLILNREEIFAILNWFDTYTWNRIDGRPENMGVFFPDSEKKKRIFFGVGGNEENGKKGIKPGFRIYRLEFKDENLMRLLCGLLDMAVFVA